MRFQFEAPLSMTFRGATAISQLGNGYQMIELPGEGNLYTLVNLTGRPQTIVINGTAYTMPEPPLQDIPYESWTETAPILSDGANLRIDRNSDISSAPAERPYTFYIVRIGVFERLSDSRADLCWIGGLGSLFLGNAFVKSAELTYQDLVESISLPPEDIPTRARAYGWRGDGEPLAFLNRELDLYRSIRNAAR